jgi:tetratricopeptide (TPR) repeat protein
MWNDFFKILNDNKDALGFLFGSGAVLAILGGFFSFIRWIIKESRLRKTRSDESFPFKIIPPNSNVAKEILEGNDNDPLADRNILYQQRVTGRNIRREIEHLLSQNHRVLVTGKTGLGKTREALHVAESLNKEGWTILYLTREQWLAAPSKLPTGVPERKLLFILDDLNRKIYASRVEQAPHAEESIMQPLNVPLQTRLSETLEVFEKLCGKNEIMVIATARDENFSEFVDEPSEWNKLEFNKYTDFWKKFVNFSLPEADDEAEINLLNSTIRVTDIKADPTEFPIIAKKNDGTFSNLIENLRTTRFQNASLQENTFRETLKGTWQKRYQEIVKKNDFAKYFYDSVEVARTIGLDTNFYNIFEISKTLAEKDPKRFNIIKNFKILQELAKKENILTPRDGQIEAKGYQVNAENYLLKIYKLVLFSSYKRRSKWSFFLIWFYVNGMHIPRSTFLTEKVSLGEKLLALFFYLSRDLYRTGAAYGRLGFQEIEALCLKKSIELSKWSIIGQRKAELRIKQWNALGYSYRNQQKYSEALVAYQEAIKIAPKDPSSWNGLGITYAGLNDSKNAITAYKKAIQFNPKFSAAWSNLGFTYHEIGRFQSALIAYKKAIDLNPKSVNPLCGLGITYSDLSQNNEAIVVLQKAIELDPSYALPWNKLGTIYRALNRNDEAIAACKKAIELDPKYSSAWYGLGYLYGESNQNDEAIAALQKVIELDPSNALPWNKLGNIYWDMNRNDDAITAYQKAIELDPKGTQLWLNLSMVNSKLKHYDEAIANCKKAIELNTAIAAPWNILGHIYRDLSQTDNAITAYQKAIELEPKTAIHWFNLGSFYDKLKRSDNAIAAFQKATELDPQYASPWNGLGVIYSDLKRNNDAIAAFQKATELDPNYTLPWYNIGIEYSSQKEYEKALLAHQKTVDLAPNNRLFRTSLASVLRHLGQEAEALEQIETAKKIIGEESEYSRASFEAVCGNVEEALRLLKIALENGDEKLDWIRQDPNFDFIRDEPRFKVLVGLE